MTTDSTEATGKAPLPPAPHLPLDDYSFFKSLLEVRVTDETLLALWPRLLSQRALQMAPHPWVGEEPPPPDLLRYTLWRASPEARTRSYGEMVSLGGYALEEGPARRLVKLHKDSLLPAWARLLATLTRSYSPAEVEEFVTLVERGGFVTLSRKRTATRYELAQVAHLIFAAFVSLGGPGMELLREVLAEEEQSSESSSAASISSYLRHAKFSATPCCSGESRRERREALAPLLAHERPLFGVPENWRSKQQEQVASLLCWEFERKLPLELHRKLLEALLEAPATVPSPSAAVLLHLAQDPQGLAQRLAMPLSWWLPLAALEEEASRATWEASREGKPR